MKIDSVYELSKNVIGLEGNIESVKNELASIVQWHGNLIDLASTSANIAERGGDCREALLKLTNFILDKQ